jgi:FdrA protein
MRWWRSLKNSGCDMSVILNEIRRGAYLDSVALMRVARTISGLPGVEEVGLMIGTPANREILREAKVINTDGETAGPGDLILAFRAVDQTSADAALAAAKQALDQPKQTKSGGSAWHPRTLRAAVAEQPDANLALISVPGAFAMAEAHKAIARGLNVMIFSDNIPVADEVALKLEAKAAGLLVMGPDCGTAIIGGVPLAFANVVPSGDIGIIGASGTGIQEITCLIARHGRGISHAIGTGGRDLKAEVGGITTLMALDLLAADDATRHIVLVSKPPAPKVAEAVLARVATINKPVTICFIGGSKVALPPNATAVSTLEGAAAHAVGLKPVSDASAKPLLPGKGRLIRGLFSGGTLCAEAQIVLMAAGMDVTSNEPVPGAKPPSAAQHTLLDLGADEYTQGRPHPMIEPAVRDQAVADAIADPQVGVILLDCVLGFGGHMDPAGHIAALLAKLTKGSSGGPLIIASVTGTEADPQGLSRQSAKLREAGVVIAPSNAAAARLAVQALKA